jgi:hypothetical protein
VGNDPDVFAFARTLAGEKSLVFVVNNQKVEQDLALLAGGGIDVQGLLPDGAAPVEATGNAAATANLRVTGGRLVGRLPALTAVLLAQP